MNKLTYKVDLWPKGIPDEEIPKGESGCDAVIIHALTQNGEGDSSELISINGETGNPLTSEELWKEWARMAQRLSKAHDLPEHKKILCHTVHEHIRTLLLNAGEERIWRT